MIICYEEIRNLNLREKLFSRKNDCQFYCFLFYDYTKHAYYLCRNPFRLEKFNELQNCLYKENYIKISEALLRALFEITDILLQRQFGEAHEKIVKLFEQACDRPNYIDKEKDIDKINDNLTHIVFIRNQEDSSCAEASLHRISRKFNEALDFVLSPANRERAMNEANQLTMDENFLNDGYIVRAYNVQQANCSMILDTQGNHVYCVCDLGDQNKNKSLARALKELDDNGFVIISHFDSDHINNYRKLGANAYRRVFIMHEPKHYKTTSTCISFLDSLYRNTAPVLIVDNGEHVQNPLPIGQFLKIYQGDYSNMSQFQSTPENTLSLVTKVDVEGRKSVFPGDALEDEFNINENNVQLLMIPHHGCNYNGQHLITEKAHLFVKHECHEKYEHPSLNHIQLYANVYRFGNCTSLIRNRNMWTDDVYTMKINISNDYIDYTL